MKVRFKKIGHNELSYIEERPPDKFIPNLSGTIQIDQFY